MADTTLRTARPLLRAWRDIVEGEYAAVAATQAQPSKLAALTSRRSAKTTFQSWSKSVPTLTRRWARLFSKLDFERHRQSVVVSTGVGEGAHGAEGACHKPQGVAKYFGARNLQELRQAFKEFMKDLSADEREEMRFVLHAEAIRRGLGKYSITTRRALPVGRP